MCNCRTAPPVSTRWEPFQNVANSGEKGFDKILNEGGIYCLRVGQVGETDVDKIISTFQRSPMYKAFQEMADVSEGFFQKCGFGPGWGWTGYATGPDNELAKIRNLPISSQKQLACPILYIGRSKYLRRRVSQLIVWEQVVNHPLWALLYSKWTIEIGYCKESDYKKAEKRAKEEYRTAHGGNLPPFMKM